MTPGSIHSYYNLASAAAARAELNRWRPHVTHSDNTCGRSGLLFILIAFTLQALPGACAAQAHKPHAPSISNPGAHAKASQLFQNVASEQTTADAIAADVLQTLWTEADKHFDKGEWNHTINLCKVVVQGDPHNEEAYADMAYLYWSTDRSDQGVAILKQGLAANPHDYYMYDELGQHYLLEAKKPALALPYYKQAVRYKCPPFTWHGLAHCYEQTGDLADAAAAWKTASQFPGDRVALVNLKRLQAKMAGHSGASNRTR